MKKLLSKRGMTLAEMLIAVLLLGFISAMVTVMTSAVLSTTTQISAVSQAEILGAEVLDNIAREIRLASRVEVENGYLAFDRGTENTDKNYYLALKEDDGKIYVGQGAIDTDSLFAESNKPDLFFGGASYGDCTVKSLTFEQTEKSGPITVGVEVAFNGKVVWSEQVTVKPLTNIIAES